MNNGISSSYLVPVRRYSPNSAPQTASASALINACTNVVIICRSRSGLAWASCSESQPDSQIWVARSSL
jgi:hypothetical protein